MASDALFSTLFSLGTSAYVACFCAAVYATTPSPAVSTFAVLALTALPAIVAADLCGNDKAAEHILGSYRREVFGTAAIVVLLCSTNAAVGHLGVEVEWPLHLALMMLCDTLSDGAQANPAVTLALWACGDCGVDCATAAGNIGAQLAGGVIGWQLLLFGFAQHLPGAVGGPRADAAVPLEYLMACEALACWVLACAVFTFATTKCFAGPSSCKYALKMALINASLRAVIHAHGLTGEKTRVRGRLLTSRLERPTASPRPTGPPSLLCSSTLRADAAHKEHLRREPSLTDGRFSHSQIDASRRGSRIPDSPTRPFGEPGARDDIRLRRQRRRVAGQRPPRSVLGWGVRRRDGVRSRAQPRRRILRGRRAPEAGGRAESIDAGARPSYAKAEGSGIAAKLGLLQNKATRCRAQRRASGCHRTAPSQVWRFVKAFLGPTKSQSTACAAGEVAVGVALLALGYLLWSNHIKTAAVARVAADALAAALAKRNKFQKLFRLKPKGF